MGSPTQEPWTTPCQLMARVVAGKARSSEARPQLVARAVVGGAEAGPQLVARVVAAGTQSIQRQQPQDVGKVSEARRLAEGVAEQQQRQVTNGRHLDGWYTGEAI